MDNKFIYLSICKNKTNEKTVEDNDKNLFSIATAQYTYHRENETKKNRKQ